MAAVKPHPDQHFIDALRRGDGLLVEEIYQRFSGAITALVVNNNGTPEDAADLMQEALLIIYKKASTGSLILSCPFEAFLYAICRNKWLMELRKKRKMPVTFTGEMKYEIDADSREAAEQLAQQAERKKLLMEKLEELNEGCRQMLLLCWKGTAMQEVARLMNMSYAYARRKKGECLGRLIKLMKDAAIFNQLKH